MICKAKHVGLITPYWHGYMYAVKFFEKPYSVLETRFEDKWQPSFKFISGRLDTLIVNYPNNLAGIMLTKDKIRGLLGFVSREK